MIDSDLVTVNLCLKIDITSDLSLKIDDLVNLYPIIMYFLFLSSMRYLQLNAK